MKTEIKCPEGHVVKLSSAEFGIGGHGGRTVTEYCYECDICDEVFDLDQCTVEDGDE